MEIYILLFGNVMFKYTSTLKVKSATKQKGTHSLASQRDSEVYLSLPKLAKIQKNTQSNHRAFTCRSFNGLNPLFVNSDFHWVSGYDLFLVCTKTEEKGNKCRKQENRFLKRPVRQILSQ